MVTIWKANLLMPTEIYYAPKDENAPLPTLTELRQRFAAAGLPCTIEPEEGAPDLWWIIFEPQSTSTILASTKEEQLVFATVEVPLDDDPSFPEKIDRVLESIGFFCEDPDQYL